MSRIALLPAVALLASGCWTQSCVLPSAWGDEVCFEYLEGLMVTDLFRDPEEPAEERCDGDASTRSCRGRGFTIECDAYWYRPGSVSLTMECLRHAATAETPPATAALP